MWKFAMGVLLLGWAQSAQAQRVPDRQVPPSVLSELALLESKFDLALSQDCDEERCFSKGCAYIAHATADRPKKTSLPGLAQDPGPGSVDAQEYLTRARCSFAYEEMVENQHVQALGRRLQSKLSKGWLVVSVDGQKLQPIADYLQQPPQADGAQEPGTEVVEEEPVEEEVLPNVEWSFSVALRELWTSLLPHLPWMIGVVMITFASTLLIWAWRRIGKESIEDKMLLAELAREGGMADEDEDDDDTAEESLPTLSDAAFVAEQDAHWQARLDAMDPANPDPEVVALVRELLRSGDMPLLAKAVLRFPGSLPAAFPGGGQVASAKLELADYLKTVDADTLPDDAAFFRSLNRHALSAAVASQADAQIVRSLREEFGAAGLASLISRLSSRPAGLLYALAPADEQHEIVRLLDPAAVAGMAAMLLRSNRMDPAETEHLFAVLTAVRNNTALPEAPATDSISDRGSPFNAVGALSVLLESVNPARRGTIFGEALNRFAGSLPSWYRGILVSDMLFSLQDEARADLMLEVEVDSLAAWMGLLDAETQQRLLEGIPSSLRNSIKAVSVFPDKSRQLALAEQGRTELANGFQAQLARANFPFERIVNPQGATTP